MTGCSIWPACCQHPALDPSRYVASLSLNDRFHLYPQRAYYLLVGIPYVQFYVQVRYIHYPHENNLSPRGNMLPIEETEKDIMRLSYASREINAMAQSYFKISPPFQPFTHIFRFHRPAFIRK
ncbi:Biotin synthase, partial [Trichinella spiralis]